MQIVYATHLVLPPSPDGAVLNEAAAAVADWVQRRFGITLHPLSGGSAVSDRARVEWASMLGESGGLIETVVDQPDQGDPLWRWKTFVDLGVEDGQAWVRVRVGLYSALEGLLTSPRVKAGRPGVVRALVDQMGLRADDWLLGEWRPIHEDMVDQYIYFLKDPARQLPVVALSDDPSGEPFLDPAHLADRLLGLAHVVTVDRPAAFRVSESVGKTLSCFLGAVRVYWPRFTEQDDPYYHRLFLGGALNYFGREGLEDELFGILGRLGGLSLDVPPLRRRLKIEQRAAEMAERAVERAETAERLAQAVHAAAGALTAEEFADFAAEFDDLQEKVDDLERSALDSEIELELLRTERDDARQQLVEIVRGLGDSRSLDVPGEIVREPPTSVHEAVLRAAETAEHCVYLPEAFESAMASSYEDPSRVMEDLQLIEEIARDWADGELPAGPNAAFKQRCSAFRDGIGQKASTQYVADYERNYRGEKILLGPHIRRGIGAVASIMRIYLYFDSDSRKIVIGHVGRKLRDASNRN